VLTVGPGSDEETLMEKEAPAHPFLFATDFSEASLKALPHAISFAHHFGARLIVLQILPAVPIPEGFHWSTAGDVNKMREQAQSASRELFDELVASHASEVAELEFQVRFGMTGEQILEACHGLKADLLVLGLNQAKHPAVESHLPWITTHEIVCGANCPVLTLKGGPL
jgi:nucleotide-binding universal stress UspA family protein